MPTLTANNARIIDNFYIDEALKGINNARTIDQFRIRDNYFIYIDILALFALLPAPGAATILTFAIPLTAAQVKVLNSVPVMAVAAPGVGKAIEIITASKNLVFNTTAYAFLTQMFLKIDTATNNFCSTGISGGSSDFNAFDLTISVNPNTFVENKALYITSSADSVVGDSPITVYGAYRIITL